MKRKRQRIGVTPNKNDLSRRFQTARRLWETGEYRRAAESFGELFDSERGDPRFSRYWRASCLFQLGSSDELDALLQQRDDHSGIWRFAQALEAFRLHGDTEDAQRLLVEAHRLEPGFEDYLLRDKALDARREVQFDAGPAERAFGCARLFLPAWRGCPAPRRGPVGSSKSRPPAPIRTMCRDSFRTTSFGHCHCGARPGKSAWCRIPARHAPNTCLCGCSGWPMPPSRRCAR